MKAKYCVINAITRQECGEKISIGIVVMSDTGSEYRYSNKKLGIACSLMNKTDAAFLKKSIVSFRKNVIGTARIPEIERRMSYLSRYSNNLIQVMPITEMTLPKEISVSNWLFKRMVYSSVKK